MDDAFGYWLAGLADGEASFGLYRQRDENMGMRPQFIIQLRADDRPMLEIIHAELGFGSLQLYTPVDRGKMNPSVRYQVQDRAGCRRVVEVFDRYPLRSKKAKEFALWREAVLMLGGRTGRGRNARRLASPDLARLYTLSEDLKMLKRFQGGNDVGPGVGSCGSVLGGDCREGASDRLW